MNGDEWAAGNRIFHRGVVPARLNDEERGDFYGEAWAGV
jgi:hypothetical protein